MTGQQNVGEFRVVAIIEDTGSFGLSSAYTSLAYLNSLIGLEPWEYQVFSIFLTDMREIEAVAGEIYQALVDVGALVERPYSDRAITYDDEVEEGVASVGADVWPGGRDHCRRAVGRDKVLRHDP